MDDQAAWGQTGEMDITSIYDSVDPATGAVVDVAKASRRRSSKQLPRNKSYQSHSHSHSNSNSNSNSRNGLVVNGANDDGDDDDEDGDGGNSKRVDAMISALHTLAGILGWAPLIITFIVQDNFKIMFLSAFVVGCFNLFFVTVILYKWNKTRSWPKTLDVIFVVVFGVLTLVTWIFPDTVDFFKNFAGLIINVSLAASVAVTWLFGYPFIKTIIADEVDPIALTHPLVKLMIQIQTGLWLGIFTVCALISIPGGVIYLKGGDTKLAFLVGTIVSSIVTVVGLIFSMWLFPAYFFAHPEKFDGPYEKEIDEWMEEHPDHEYSNQANWGGDAYVADGNKTDGSEDNNNGREDVEEADV